MPTKIFYLDIFNKIIEFNNKKITTPRLVTLGVVGDTSTQILAGIKVGDQIEVSYK